MPYGVANKVGQVGRDEAMGILEHASGAGMDTLDTAIGYGESERRLGEIGVGQWRIISKLPAPPDTCTDVLGWAEESLAGSLARLRIGCLHGLLLHSSTPLLGPRGDALYGALARLRTQGLVKKIGVSIYCPAELDVLQGRFHLDVVQAPFNILDRRLAASGWLRTLHEAGIEVHTRSLFLQGLLLMDAASRPVAFNRWQPLWDRWDGWLARERLTPLQATLNFAFSRPEIDRIIVGVDSLTHLRDILAAGDPGRVDFPEHLQSGDLALIDPSKWKYHEKM